MSYLTNPYRYAVEPFDLSELKVYAKFDEASGNIINQATSVGSSDSLGSGADQVVSGATYGADGIIDKALSFDGINDYTAFGTSLSQFNFFHGVDQDWSINFWVYVDDFNEAYWLSSLDPTETSGINIKMRVPDDTTHLGIAVYAGAGNYLISTAKAWGRTLAVDTWYMLTITCDYSDTVDTYKVYSNAVEGSTGGRGSKVGGAGNAEEPLIFGVHADLVDHFYAGRVDELSLWNRQLSEDEITRLYNSGNALAL